MSLNAALSLLIEELAVARESVFAKNAVADFVRKDLPDAIRESVGLTERYLIKGSPGQGGWSGVPWAAILDRLVTESAQDGYYVVYLVKEDLSGIYLSLNQGVTSAKKRYRRGSKEVLRIRAMDFLARLGSLTGGLLLGRIDLAVTSPAGLGAYYEEGAICSMLYPRAELPDDDALSLDLKRFLGLYLTLVSNEANLFERGDTEEDELGLAEENLRDLREHKRIERNKTLAAQAKKAHGFKCKACGFDFSSQYGSIGKGFIEAHHLTPLAQLKGQTLMLDPKRDFTVLCANCHRMIHRSEFVNKVEEFRAHYIVHPIGQKL